ncbi:MAG TPA: SRPBCC family protein [Acidimicrobiia bacterium]|nr:SRPBCC family protein [Acidimicrobiia bacterium]
MARITVTRYIPTHPGVVWDALSDLESHDRWMGDARSIEITSDRKRGVGTRMRVRTVIGPFRTTDIIEVVRWAEGRLIAIRHEGVIGGRGILGVESDGEGSVITWAETIFFPWRLGGPLTAWLAAPFFAAVWRRNLKRLESVVAG